MDNSTPLATVYQVKVSYEVSVRVYAKGRTTEDLERARDWARFVAEARLRVFLGVRKEDLESSPLTMISLDRIPDTDILQDGEVIRTFPVYRMTFMTTLFNPPAS